MVFYATFNSISVIQWPQLTLFMLSWDSPVLGWGSEVSCPRTLPRKTQRIQWGSNPGPLEYESNTLPLSHAGPLFCGKGENAGNLHFLFPTVFSALSKRKIVIIASFNLWSKSAFSLVMSKNLSFGKDVF